jgi:hypothetical protein
METDGRVGRVLSIEVTQYPLPVENHCGWSVSSSPEGGKVRAQKK